MVLAFLAGFIVAVFTLAAVSGTLDGWEIGGVMFFTLWAAFGIIVFLLVMYAGQLWYGLN